MRTEAEIRNAAQKISALADFTEASGNMRGAVLFGAHVSALEWALGEDNGSKREFLMILDAAEGMASEKARKA